MSRTTALRQQRKKDGLCPYCGRKVPDGQISCDKCLAERRQKYIDRKAAGLCIECGRKSREGYTRCLRCALKASNREKGKRKKDV